MHENPKYFGKNFFDMYALKYKAFVTNHVHSDYCSFIWILQLLDLSIYKIYMNRLLSRNTIWTYSKFLYQICMHVKIKIFFGRYSCNAVYLYFWWSCCLKNIMSNDQAKCAVLSFKLIDDKSHIFCLIMRQLQSEHNLCAPPTFSYCLILSSHM